MAKLKKSIKQEQRRAEAIRSKGKVTKLTPSEIRSLHHGPVPSADGNGHVRVKSRDINSPPLTPDIHGHSRSKDQQAVNDRTDLPTPPISPAHGHRRSKSSNKHIHAPKPLSHPQAAALALTHTRSSSQSSYRGVSTYRGPEITRNGSLSMLQAPSRNIVSNPLSQFSRPRQSVLISASRKNEENLPGECVKAVSDKAEESAQKLPPKSTTMPHSTLLSGGKSDIDQNTTALKASCVDKNVAEETAAAKSKSSWRKTFTVNLKADDEPQPVRKEFRRRTFMTSMVEPSIHSISYNDTKAGSPPEMRKTLKYVLPSSKTAEFSKSETQPETEYAQHPAVRPLNSPSIKSQSPLIPREPTMTSPRLSSSASPRTRSMQSPELLLKSFQDQSDAHSRTIQTKSPQPHSGIPSPPPSFEVKSPGPSSSPETATTSNSKHSRCTCCGRRAPKIIDSDLTPVLEHDRRSTFSFEPDRTSQTIPQYVPRERYNPTIATPSEHRQNLSKLNSPESASSIDLTSKPVFLAVAKNRPGDVIVSSSVPLAIMPKTTEAPKFTRFSSLHAKKGEHLTSDKSSQSLAQPAQLSRFSSLYGLREESQQQKSLTTSVTQPVLLPHSETQPALMNARHQPVKSSRLNFKYSPVDEAPEEHWRSSSLYPLILEPEDEVLPNDSIRSLGIHYQQAQVLNSGHQRVQNMEYSQYTGYQPVEHDEEMRNNAFGNSPRSLSSSVSSTSTPGPINTKLANTTKIYSNPSPTIIRIIPSYPISSSSSLSSAKTGKLGDWVLPEGPDISRDGQNGVRKDVGVAV